MKKSEYLKLNARDAKFIWRGHEILSAIGVRNQVLRCRINERHLFVAEVLEEDGEKGYRINVYWNKKLVATAYTEHGFRVAGHLAVNMLRGFMTAKNTRHRFEGWEPEEEEAK